jgi:hypothetical protein
MVALPTAARFPTAEAIYAAYAEDNDDTERTYLGASVIGDECERKLWLAFRWAFPPERFEGRMLRLFQTGHREEDRLIADLKRIGVVFDEMPDGEQHAVRFAGGHGGGHLDGIIVSGVIEAPAARHVFEAKTHNTKSFAKLVASGVKAAKPMHYAQMQIYMHLKGIDRAFYCAVEKDTDSIYTERVRVDPVAAMALIGKASRIVFGDTPPAKISEKPDFYLCRFCAYPLACHGSAWPRMNCRTCLHAMVVPNDGEWRCGRHDRPLSRADQESGCANHLFIPDLIPGRQIDADPEKETVTYALRDGGTWTDGAGEVRP